MFPQCCNLLLVETLKDPLCFRVSDQTIPKQQHVVQVSRGGGASTAGSAILALSGGVPVVSDQEPGGEEVVGSLPEEADRGEPPRVAAPEGELVFAAPWRPGPELQHPGGGRRPPCVADVVL